MLLVGKYYKFFTIFNSVTYVYQVLIPLWKVGYPNLRDLIERLKASVSIAIISPLFLRSHRYPVTIPSRFSL